MTGDAGIIRDERCGTHAGVSEHRRRHETPCGPCKAFWREYTARMRKRRGTAYDKWWNRTSSAARVRLAAEYPERFAEILAQVRAENPSPWDPEAQP